MLVHVYAQFFNNYSFICKVWKHFLKRGCILAIKYHALSTMFKTLWWEPNLFPENSSTSLAPKYNHSLMLSTHCILWPHHLFQEISRLCHTYIGWFQSCSHALSATTIFHNVQVQIYLTLCLNCHSLSLMLVVVLFHLDVINGATSLLHIQVDSMFDLGSVLASTGTLLVHLGWMHALLKLWCHLLIASLLYILDVISFKFASIAFILY